MSAAGRDRARLAEPRLVAPGADLRTDVPRYRVYRHGELVEEPRDLHGWWRDDLVGFLLGCSFTFENALLQAGVPVRHIEAGCNVPMYRTNIACQPAGVFRGPMVVSMRPLTPAQAVTAVAGLHALPAAHGAPVHFGDPAAIGIRDIGRPDFGDAVEIRSGRGAGVLGVRRDAAGGGDGGQAAAAHHAQAGTHVRDGSARYRLGRISQTV